MVCSIVASFDYDMIKYLSELNAYRGSLNHSVSYIDDEITVNRYEGSFDLNHVSKKPIYTIIHQQAPTQSSKSIHPAQINSTYLWHNGILKNTTINEFQKKYDENEKWDTKLLLHKFLDNGLNDIDGTFACVMYHSTHLYVFRNKIAPIFLDEYINISSTRFDNSYSLPPDELFEINLSNRTINSISKFKTVETPYFFLED